MNCGAASDLAGYCRHGLRPLGFIARFACAEVDSEGAELGGARGLRCASVNIGAPRNLEINEPGGYHRCFKLCVQQSARDSPLPQVDVLLALLRYCFLHEDVADLEAAAPLENSRHFLESGELVGKEV